MPPRHPYVSAVLPEDAVAVRPGRVSGWEPDPFFDLARVAAWAAEIDVVHLHFGYDHLVPAQAQAWVAACDRAGLPLVLTVHDLRNPHHPDRGGHDAVLSVLVPAASAVLTLTRAAAADLAARFGRPALVVPHPTLVDPARTADVVTQPGLVALHLKSLRTNVPDPVAVAAAAHAGAVRAGGRLEVDLHPAALADRRLDGLEALVAASGAGLIVRVHERFDDLALERYLRRAHVSVLPYRWGTHSGWLELARDLGTRTVAPSCGHYAEQWSDVVAYGYDEEHGLAAAGLAAAVAAALRAPAPDPADRALRLAEAAQVRSTHARTYAAVRAAAGAGEPR